MNGYLIDDPDYQRFPYVFGTEPGYGQDMTGPIREAARAVLRDYVSRVTNLLEVGVWEGRSACWLLDNVLCHPLSTYTGVDAWVSPPSIPTRARTHLAYHGHKARLIEGDSKVEVPKLCDTFHIAIVDGDHSEAGCLADLRNCWDRLCLDGILICDDYAYPGLPGVPAAVHRFIDERGPSLQTIYKSTAIAFRKVRL